MHDKPELQIISSISNLKIAIFSAVESIIQEETFLEIKGDLKFYQASEMDGYFFSAKLDYEYLREWRIGENKSDKL